MINNTTIQEEYDRLHIPEICTLDGEHHEGSKPWMRLFSYIWQQLPTEMKTQEYLAINLGVRDGSYAVTIDDEVLIDCNNCEEWVAITPNNYVAYGFNPRNENDIGDVLTYEDYVKKYEDKIIAIERFQDEALTLCIPCHKVSLDLGPYSLKLVRWGTPLEGTLEKHHRNFEGHQCRVIRGKNHGII